MNELQETLWVEKYRPRKFTDLICQHTPVLKKYLSSPKSIPSFIFYSSRPGTGKTSTAKILSNELDCDLLTVNASDERGIDTIRDKIKNFAQALSTNPDVKRCVFLDEADGLTKQAQESMKALMEMYSGNCFFILSCNDLAKVIEPIRKGRCIAVDFANPPIAQILKRLMEICSKEEIQEYSKDQLEALVKVHYPDIRSMILTLQNAKIEGKETLVDSEGFEEFKNLLFSKNVKKVYEIVGSGTFDISGFNRFLFHRIFEKADKIQLAKLSELADLCADTEKNWKLGASLEVVFLSNMLKIMERL